jgi:hypothetical protein
MENLSRYAQERSYTPSESKSLIFIKNFVSKIPFREGPVHYAADNRMCS